MNSPTEPDSLSRVASSCLVVGGILALLGGLSIAAPWAASTVVDFLVGIALVAGGVSQIGMSALTFTWRGFWLTLLCGVLSVVAGTAMLAIPVEGIHVLATFLGVVILFEAAAKLTAAVSAPSSFPRGWLLLDGIVTAFLGGLLLTSTKEQAVVYVGLLVGINLLSSGISLVATGLWLRRRPA
ncbi:MAG: HdeD family acid-resistance protein [Planctomycetaceae bacterium]